MKSGKSERSKSGRTIGPDGGDRRSAPVRPSARPGRERLNLTFLVLLLLVSAAAFFYIVRMFFIPVLLALTLATLFHPFYERLARLFGERKSLAALVTVFIVFLGLVIPAGLIVQLLAGQLVIFTRNLQAENFLSRENLATILDNAGNLPIFRWIRDLNFQIDWQGGLRTVMSHLGEFISLVVNRTSSGVIGVVTTVLVTLFTLFYFLRDGRAMVAQLLYLSPLRREYEERLLDRFATISRATLKGTVVIGFIQGAMGALTLLLFGVPTWVVWGVVMIILGILPLLGPGLVLIPAAIIMIVSGQIWQGIVVALISLVLIGAVDNLLRPRLVGQGARMHDLLIFFSTLGGIAVFGFLGFIIGPVIAAFFTALLTIYGTEFRESLWSPKAPGPGPDELSGDQPGEGD